jgi:hypothetical protein
MSPGRRRVRQPGSVVADRRDGVAGEPAREERERPPIRLEVGGERRSHVPGEGAATRGVDQGTVDAHHRGGGGPEVVGGRAGLLGDQRRDRRRVVVASWDMIFKPGL